MSATQLIGIIHLAAKRIVPSDVPHDLKGMKSFNDTTFGCQVAKGTIHINDSGNCMIHPFLGGIQQPEVNDDRLFFILYYHTLEVSLFLLAKMDWNDGHGLINGFGINTLELAWGVGYRSR
jgi:hypothetical protein